MHDLSSLWNVFILSFIPIFVSIDAPSAVPLFLGLVAGKSQEEKSKIVLYATITAFVVAVGFILIGEAVFRIMGITLEDFRIAGGILLFILATAELMGSAEERRRPAETVGIFPIGIPLIIGPAALATLLMQNQAHGHLITILALVVNLLIVYLVLRYADFVNRILGDAGSAAFAKVANLLLATIGVMMVRRGLEDLHWVIKRN
jgi:multiple antibiotic resistance protein